MNNKSPIRQAIEEKVVNIINPPKQSVKKPSNRLWLAVVGFNLIFFVVDLITAIAVGVLTTWYYGVLVFFAGILPMLFHEGLFSNPYASQWQRWIAGAGFAFSVFSALFVGVLIVIINVMFDNTATGKLLETISMALLFGIAVIHGGLMAGYFFIDYGIRAVQNAMRAMAANERKLREIEMAGEIVDTSKVVIGKIESSHIKGDGKLLDAALESIAGDGVTVSPNGKNPEKYPTRAGE